MKKFFNDLKKEYALITTPSYSEVVYISFLVVSISLFLSLSILGFDYIIGLFINTVLFN